MNLTLREIKLGDDEKDIDEAKFISHRNMSKIPAASMQFISKRL
jgi:hypothetical protein